MKVHLIAPAILALLVSAPASAQLAQPSGPSWSGAHGGGGNGGWHRDRDRDRHRDRHHRRDRNVIVSYGDSGTWALYNNRSWEPESYNDWWHARPERNTPRWVLNNQDCQRQYWSGGGWRC